MSNKQIQVEEAKESEVVEKDELGKRVTYGGHKPQTDQRSGVRYP